MSLRLALALILSAGGVAHAEQLAADIKVGSACVRCHEAGEGNGKATELGYKTIASNYGATALGRITVASGAVSTAMGYNSTASGNQATAMGYETIAAGDVSTATGHYTTAAGGASFAMGSGVTAHDDESLAVSGDVYARNFLFNADERLMANKTQKSGSLHGRRGLLRSVSELRVVEYDEPTNGPSTQSLHRTLGLVAHPDRGSARSGVSMAGLTSGPERVQSMDLRVVVAQLVGAVQELASQNRVLADQNARQSNIIATQGKKLAELHNWREAMGRRGGL